MGGLKRFARLFLFRWQNLLGLAIVLSFIGVAIAAPDLAPPDDPAQPASFHDAIVGGRHVPRPPSRELPLGTTPDGYDIFYTMVWGTRSVLRFGLVAALTTACLGTLIGALSGYPGGWINGLAMRVTDAFLTFPAIAAVWFFNQIPVVAMVTAIQSSRQWGTVPAELLNYTPTPFERMLLFMGVNAVMLALITFSWMPYARIINVQVARLRQEEYVLAARSVGAGGGRIVFRHLLPNAIAPAIVLVARDIGSMVITAAAFTFIGISGGSEWGILLVMGRNWIIGPGGNVLGTWWVFLPATLALILFGVAWNLLGDGLNDALNPRGRSHKRTFI